MSADRSNGPWDYNLPDGRVTDALPFTQQSSIRVNQLRKAIAGGVDVFPTDLRLQIADSLQGNNRDEISAAELQANLDRLFSEKPSFTVETGERTKEEQMKIEHVGQETIQVPHEDINVGETLKDKFSLKLYDGRYVVITAGIGTYQNAAYSIYTIYYVNKTENDMLLISSAVSFAFSSDKSVMINSSPIAPVQQSVEVILYRNPKPKFF